MFRSTKSGKPKSEAQRESRRDRLTASVKEIFHRSSSRPSSSSQQPRQPSPIPPPQTDDHSHLIQAQRISNEQQQTNDLWSKAYKQRPGEYTEGLDNLDKMDALQKLFAIANQVEEQNAAKQFKLKWGDKEIDVREKVVGFVGCLNKFKEIRDIVVQYDPVHAALPWAGVRFILMVCKSPQLLCRIVLTSPS